MCSSVPADTLLEAVLSDSYTKPSTLLILPVAAVLKKSPVSSLMVGCLDLFSRQVLFLSPKSFVVLPGYMMFVERT